MRQAGQQYGSGAPPVAPRGGHPGGGFRGAHEHGHGHGHGSSGGDGERTGPANELSKKATIALDIKRFFQPWGAFSDQATLEGYGVRKRYPKCMRCGAVKLKDHPDFKDCMGRCDCCGSSMAHIGEMCSQTWASMKWHMEHNGWLPDDVQFRPTPEQCAEFAKVDPYFGRIVPLQEIIQAPAGQGTKRKADDRDDEVEKAAAARRDEVRVQQLKRLQAAADGLTRALNAQKIATQQAEALAWERGRTNDQQSEELENLRLVVTKKEAATKRPLKTNRELVEEIRSVKDAESRREESNRLAMEKNAARIGRFGP